MPQKIEDSLEEEKGEIPSLSLVTETVVQHPSMSSDSAEAKRAMLKAALSLQCILNENSQVLA